MTEKTYAYFDTSTWLKLYVRERGSEEARDLAREHQSFSSAILLIECLSALSQKWLAGEIGGKGLNRLIKMIKTDINSLEIIHITDTVLDKAQEIVLQRPARPMDAIHIASALTFQEMADVSFVFITSDRKQYDVAMEMGLNSIFVI